MKITWLPLSLSLTRTSLRPALLILPLLAGASVVRAQEGPRIIFPQPDQDVRGEILARFDGIPAGGYAIIKVDGKFKTATAQNNLPLDTISDFTTFGSQDAPHTLEVTAINAGGRAIGTASVKFNVANQKVAGDSEAVRLVHWMPADRLNDGVQRFRVFAESIADIQEPTSGAGGGGEGGGGGGRGSSGGGGGDAAGGNYIAAPLDWQVSVLLRREVRDINGFQNSANIATLVAEAWEHQRISEAATEGEGEGGAPSARGGSSGGRGAAPSRAGGGARGGAAAADAPPVKAGWAPDWQQGPEFAKFYVKAIQQTGDEINATRKRNNVAIADLLPTFVTSAVRPGSSWQSRQSILSDLSTRKPINIEGTVTFTSYENIQTPGGESRRCAKIESRFPLPEGVSKRIAADLGNKVGTTGAGGGAEGGGSAGGRGAPSPGGAAGGEGAAEATLLPEDIKVAQFNMARVIWFDMDKHQVVRSEDTLRAYFEIPPTEGAEGGAGGSSAGAPSRGGTMSRGGMMTPGAEGGAETAPAEPTKINYSMNVTTWLDDRLPSPTLRYTGGARTAHSRDNATEPGIGRVTGR